MTHSKKARTTALVALLGVSLVGAACGKRVDPLDIGLKRVALDLAFKDAELTPPPVDPKTVTRFIDEEFFEEEAEPEFFEPKRVVRVIPARRPAEPPCPTSDPAETPEIPAFSHVKDQPTVGDYKRHNTGTGSLELGANAGAAAGVPLSVSFPFPPRTVSQIKNVRETFASTYLNPDDAKQLPAEARANTTAFPRRIEFDLVKPYGRLLTVIDTFRYNPLGDGTGDLDFLWLIKRVTIGGGQTKEFNPTPPIRYFGLYEEGIEGSTETHGGVDRATNTAMTVESAHTAREVVDICGENFDSYRVEIRERMVDLSKNPPDETGNDPAPAPPTVWNVEYGNLNILRIIDTSYIKTSVVFDLDGGGPQPPAPVPVTVRWNYTSTLDKVTPEPLDSVAAQRAVPAAPAPPPTEEEE